MSLRKLGWKRFDQIPERGGFSPKARHTGWIPIFLAMSLCLPAFSGLVYALEVKLAWDANQEEDLKCYRVYYWMVGGFSSPRTNVVETTNTFHTIKDLKDGKRYHFYVTAVNELDLESLPSNYVTNQVTYPDRAVVNQGGWTASLSSGANNVLANDILLPDRDYTDKVVLLEEPRNGQVKLNGDGTFFYQHFGGSDLQDSFQYGITNGSFTNSAPVKISIFTLGALQVSGNDLAIDFNADNSSTYELEWNYESPWKEGAWTESRSLKRSSAGGTNLLTFHLSQHAQKDQVFYRLAYKTSETNLTIGPLGYMRKTISPGTNYLGLPFHAPPAFAGAVKNVDSSAVMFNGFPFTPDGFDMMNGFYQYILIRTKPIDPTSLSGQWWPISYNTGNTLYLCKQGEDLAPAPGDQVEIRKLSTFRDIFGPYDHEGCLLTSPDESLENGDLIRFLTQGVVSYPYFYYSGSQRAEGYYHFHSDDDSKQISGWTDGSWLTLYPGQAFEISTKQRDLIFRFFGLVETGPFIHYPNPGSNWICSVYPVSIPLTESGLSESGWQLDEILAADFNLQPATGYLLDRGPSDPSIWWQKPPVMAP